MIKSKVGLLPLYLELYDIVMPEMRSRLKSFTEIIAGELKKRGIIVFTAPICRINKEFSRAIKSFEKENVHSIVTLHLAYSPSLESAEELSKTEIPIIVLDTTQAYDFGPTQDPSEIMYNHGIHGVQDMCNVLLRMGKNFIIEAGHWDKSDVLDRVVKKIRATSIISSLRESRVGAIGGFFKGMGDFYVYPETLKNTIGIETINTSTKDIIDLLPSPDDEEVKEEIKFDTDNFQIDGLKKEVHINTTRVSIAIRRWIKKENLSAFTINFLKIDKDSGFPTLPFLEASKAMARGIGYAGEGDVLTSALVGALLSVYPEASFIEMFCPDWKGNRIFLSHMGEMNINLVSGRPRLIEKRLPFLSVEDTVIAVGKFKPGKAVLINLAPGKNNSYTLIVSQIAMVGVKVNDKMVDVICGWFVPSIPIKDFLAEFSIVGGTHHSVLVYGDVADEIISFGEMMGWNVIKI